VEFQLHGSPQTLEGVVAICIGCGARLAEPGEFTRRAFVNGKLDLIQVEAVAELINAQSEAEAKAARRRLDGQLSADLERLREGTIDVLAELEADIDFPDENLPIEARPTLLNKIKENQLLGQKLRASYDANRRLQTGFFVSLVGRPNVGKSSLFNALLRFDRAIVTSAPGTTRDTLREELILDGRRVRLVDTAGIRNETSDPIERLGMDRTEEEIQRADLVCMILAADEGLTKADELMLERLSKGSLWTIWNKIDAAPPPTPHLCSAKTFSLSATRGDGVDAFRSALGSAALQATEEGCGGISNDRQRDLLDQYLCSIDRGWEATKERVSPEFVAFEFRQAYRALSKILGKGEDVEDILDEIFTRFCVGK
jgi:tRNA modification GTPase